MLSFHFKGVVVEGRDDQTAQTIWVNTGVWEADCVQNRSLLLDTLQSSVTAVLSAAAEKLYGSKR